MDSGRTQRLISKLKAITWAIRFVQRLQRHAVWRRRWHSWVNVRAWVLLSTPEDQRSAAFSQVINTQMELNRQRPPTILTYYDSESSDDAVW